MGSSRILLMAAFLVLCLPTGARDRKGGRVIRYDDSARPVIASRGQWIVAAKDGNILICRLADEQHIKEYSAPKQ